MKPVQAAESVLVVGGSGRIGGAVVSRFQAAGARVIATHHQSAAPEHARAGDWRRLDVTSEPALRAFTAGLVTAGETFDVVVVVAGLLEGKALSGYSPAMIDSVMAANFSGPAKLIAALLPHLNENSRVIMFSSVSGERGSFDPVYAAAKGAVVAFVKSMATWLAPRTRFVAIAPGLVEDSGMFEAMAPERRQFHEDATPVGRLIAPDDIAGIVYDLTRQHWAHANGTCVRINGGAYV